VSDIPLSSSGIAAAHTLPPRSGDPVVRAALTPRLLTDRMVAIVLREHGFFWWYLAQFPVAGLLGALMLSMVWLFFQGLGVWGISWPVMWGFAIINYVWWIGIGCGALFISSFFYLIGAPWRAGISRLAECIALFSAAAAGIFPILHLGRLWFFYWLFPYPNVMGYWPNWRSPLLWDFWGILSFIAVTTCFWLLGLIPDFAVLRDRASTRGRQLMYGFLAVGFRGSNRQWAYYRSAYTALAVLALLASCNTHSVAALDFAGAAVPGWHLTEMPPYFLFGAVLSGAAMILFLGLPLRRLLRLGDIMTGWHVDMLCRIMLVASLLVAYAYALEAFMTWYGGDPAEKTMFADRTRGEYWYIYWGTVLFNVVLPQLFWIRPLRFVQSLVIGISFLVLVGMWMDPYALIVGSLFRPNLPSAWGSYHGSWFDWLLLIGSVGLFLWLILLCVRLLPLVNIRAMRAVLAGRQP
jgi:molybdopterin-containing oxidoreductase family membrane subunit